MQGEKIFSTKSLKCPWTNFSSSDKKAKEAEGWGSESWPQAVLLVEACCCHSMAYVFPSGPFAWESIYLSWTDAVSE